MPRRGHTDTPEDLSPSAYVILGMLRLGARSGYEIKQIVEVSVRHFWAISYPQIYPELKRLEKAGLVSGAPDEGSGRRRVLYELTAAGKAELRRWASAPAVPSFEVRDLGLLKLMFADAAEAGARRELVAALRRRSEGEIARLEETSRLAAGAAKDAGYAFPMHVVDGGVEIHRAIIRWARRIERELDDRA